MSDSIEQMTETALNILDALHAERAVVATQAAVIAKLREELENISNANPSSWGDMADQFEPWAKSRARGCLAATAPRKDRE